MGTSGISVNASEIRLHQWFGCAGKRSSANSKFYAKLHKVHQYLSSDSIIEICPPGGKKSGRLKVLSGRFGNCQQYGHQ